MGLVRLLPWHRTLWWGVSSLQQAIRTDLGRQGAGVCQLSKSRS